MWQFSDKTRLWLALNLDRIQLEQGSTLCFLMDLATDFDTRNNTNLVEQIQSLLTDIESLKADYPTPLDGSDRIKRSQISGQIEVEYFQGNTQQTVKQEIESKKTQILNLLDPNQLLLCERSPYARVIV